MFIKFIKWLGFHVHEWEYSYYNREYKRFYVDAGESRIRKEFQKKKCKLCGYEKIKLVSEIDLI